MFSKFLVVLNFINLFEMFVASLSRTGNESFLLRNVLEEFDSLHKNELPQSDDHFLGLAKVFYYLHSSITDEIETGELDVNKMSVNFQNSNDSNRNNICTTEAPTKLCENALVHQFIGNEPTAQFRTSMTETDVKRFLLNKWFSIKTSEKNAFLTNIKYNTLNDDEESSSGHHKERIRVYKSIPLNGSSTYSILTEIEETNSEETSPLYPNEKLGSSHLSRTLKRTERTEYSMFKDADNSQFFSDKNLINGDSSPNWNMTTDDNETANSNRKTMNDHDCPLLPIINSKNGNTSSVSGVSSESSNFESLSEINESNINKSVSLSSSSDKDSYDKSSLSSRESSSSGSYGLSTADDGSSESSAASTSDDDCFESSSAENSSEDDRIWSSSTESRSEDDSSVSSSADDSNDEAALLTSAESTTDVDRSLSLASDSTTGNDSFTSHSTENNSDADCYASLSDETATDDEHSVSLSTEEAPDGNKQESLTAESTTDDYYSSISERSTTDDSSASDSEGSSENYEDSVSCLGESARCGDDSMTTSVKGSSHACSLMSYSGESETDGNSLKYPYDILTNLDHSQCSYKESKHDDSSSPLLNEDETQYLEISQDINDLSICPTKYD